MLDEEWIKSSGKSTGEETEEVLIYLARAASVTKHKPSESILFYFNYHLRDQIVYLVIHSLTYIFTMLDFYFLKKKMQLLEHLA